MNEKRLCLWCAALFVVPWLALRSAAQEPEKLTLKSAVTLALQNSRDLALARVQYNVSQNIAGVDRAEFRPNLYTGSGVAYSNGFPETPGGAAPSVFSLSYTQTLFNLPLRGQLHADEDRAQNQRLELERMRGVVIVRAASDYLELAKIRHTLDLMRAERASAQRILEVTRERAGAGFELAIEVTKGELTLARIEHRVIQLEGRDDVLSEQLRDLTGLPADQKVEVSAEEELPAGVEQSAGQLMDLALASDPLLKEAENERLARQHVLKGERGGYWPTVSLVGEYSVLSRINNYDQFFKKFQRNNVNIGLQVQIPIFAARTNASVALAKSQLDAAEMALISKRRDLRWGVEQKIRGARELDAAREVARLELKVAQESLGMVQARFDEGRAGLRDLEQARLDESEKWILFLDADFAWEQGQLLLLQSTGQLARVFQ
jgi:outer membrane protein